MTDLTPDEPSDEPPEPDDQTESQLFGSLGDEADPFATMDHVAASGDEDPADRDGSILSFLFELPILILVALVVAVVIKTFLIQAFFIPSGSMIPTLEVDDRVMVNKLSYAFGEPGPGEVVVFDSPFGNGETDESLVDKVIRNVTESLGIRTATAEDDLIKRIVATGGDTVEIRDNVVLVNGLALDEPYLAAGATMADMELREIPVGTVWVMGDNRSRSVDSRRFGPVDADTIIGRAFVRMWPFDRFGGL